MFNKKFLLIFSTFLLISLIFVFLNYGNKAIACDNYSCSGRYLHNMNTDYNKSINIEPWLSFLGILSTLFAIFFVYTGFKIENTKEKISDAEKRILNLESKIQEDIYEYASQLEYCMSFIIQKQFDKAIDSLTVLRSEPYVLKDNRKINTCNFFLAHCYYEKGLLEKDIDRKKENLAWAVEYINQAIEDPTHPLRNEIINAFKETDQ